MHGHHLESTDAVCQKPRFKHQSAQRIESFVYVPSTFRVHGCGLTEGSPGAFKIYRQRHQLNSKTVTPRFRGSTRRIECFGCVPPTSGMHGSNPTEDRFSSPWAFDISHGLKASNRIRFDSAIRELQLCTVNVSSASTVTDLLLAEDRFSSSRAFDIYHQHLWRINGRGLALSYG
ncbi:hypothetical protein SCHPADRAFT_897180 [Schizopora paradoxa]|uniref:Uncharacterized protein n=1 Tax=Schizopora paradoxa TaxID=27342 RepID=A0A0H2RH82_9AGAM|nr:hypothetical protein SCHPADRAFT_897180 [Schizopora paradoxa]